MTQKKIGQAGDARPGPPPERGRGHCESGPGPRDGRRVRERARGRRSAGRGFVDADPQPARRRRGAPRGRAGRRPYGPRGSARAEQGDACRIEAREPHQDREQAGEARREKVAVARPRTGQLVMRGGISARARQGHARRQDHARMVHARHRDYATAERRKAKLVRDLAAGHNEAEACTRASAPDTVATYAAALGSRLAAGDVANLRVHVLPVLGAMALDDVKPAHVKSIRDKVLASNARRHDGLRGSGAEGARPQGAARHCGKGTRSCCAGCSPPPSRTRSSNRTRRAMYGSRSNAARTARSSSHARS